MNGRQIKRSSGHARGSFEPDARMCRITVGLPTETMAWIIDAAIRRGVSSATIIREIVTTAHWD